MTDWRQETVDTYNKSAKELAEYFRGIGSRTDDINRAFELAGNPPNAKVIEIGCGDGRDAAEIVKLTNNYTGFDISAELIKLAQKQAPSGRFEVAGAEDYLLPEGLDIVFAFASLLHIDKAHVKDILARVHDALKPGGIFYISLKYAPTYKEKIKEDRFGRRKFYFYNPELIKELAGDIYQTVYNDNQSMGDTQWFTIALRRNV